MHHITLRKQWVIKAPVDAVCHIVTDFEHMPEHFPKIAKSIQVLKREGNHVDMEATVKSFGRAFKVNMHTEILLGKGFISDNDSYQFGTSGHEELFLSAHPEGTLVDYTYQVSIHKAWLRVIATPLIKWYAMKAWEKAFIDELKKMVESDGSAVSSERSTLYALEQEGKWVFHGSPSNIEVFEPRQAYHYPNNSQSGRVPDDNPAVFTSPFADIAIFMALINKTNIPKGLRRGFSSRDDGSVGFRVTKETMDQIHNLTGYVYVFEKAKFIPRSSSEYLSYSPVTPDDVVTVTERDLPKNIDVVSF